MRITTVIEIPTVTPEELEGKQSELIFSFFPNGTCAQIKLAH